MAYDYNKFLSGTAGETFQDLSNFFLRLDGTNNMTGSLNLNNNNIINGSSVFADTLLSTSSVLADNINEKTATNKVNITNLKLTDNQIIRSNDKVITFPDVNGVALTNNSASAVLSKGLQDNSVYFYGATDGSKRVYFNLNGNIPTATSRTYECPNDNGFLILDTATQTLTNKTLTDSTTSFQDDSDNTKKLKFQLSSITTGNTRTLTIPDSDGTISLSTFDGGSLPDLRFADYSESGLSNYITHLSYRNRFLKPREISYTHGATALQHAYSGSVYDPMNDRIYFIPNAQSNQTSWHFVNCINGTIQSYIHGTTPTAGAYIGGAFSPDQGQKGRIYMSPYGQSNQSSVWHYIDCNDGSVQTYVHGLAIPADINALGYIGSVYSPIQNRVYFIPAGQSNHAEWHYIDCSTGNVVGYAHGTSLAANAYSTGCYSPAQNRIYLCPAGAHFLQSTWHYIDCSTGNVVGYAHGATVVSAAYGGLEYSPTQNRLYFIPFAQGPETNWHFIDCDDGSVNSYAHGATVVSGGYNGGCFNPTENRIFFAPYAQANQSNWHYIDCNTGNIVAYTSNSSAIANAYNDGAYCATLNRIYFTPGKQANLSTWDYVQSLAGKSDKILPSCAIFNKY
jgi:hypothetical protein